MNKNHERFMYKYNEMGEIAPRDIVSRAIFSEMKKTGSEYVYLDITHKDSDYLKKRFPTIYRSCLEHGVDITNCLLYTSDAADDLPCVDLGGRRIIKKKIK